MHRDARELLGISEPCGRKTRGNPNRKGARRKWPQFFSDVATAGLRPDDHEVALGDECRAARDAGPRRRGEEDGGGALVPGHTDRLSSSRDRAMLSELMRPGCGYLDADGGHIVAQLELNLARSAYVRRHADSSSASARFGEYVRSANL
jgi:hypothetical protein